MLRLLHLGDSSVFFGSFCNKHLVNLDCIGLVCFNVRGSARMSRRLQLVSGRLCGTHSMLSGLGRWMVFVAAIYALWLCKATAVKHADR